jgi:hypothetical protein
VAVWTCARLRRETRLNSRPCASCCTCCLIERPLPLSRELSLAQWPRPGVLMWQGVGSAGWLWPPQTGEHGPGPDPPGG